jgi:hypothetical protein
MEISNVENWLKFDGEYSHGVALYNHFGTSNIHKTLFKGPYSKFNHTKLKSLLKEFLDSQPKKLVIEVKPTFNRETTKRSHFDKNDLPDSLKSLHAGIAERMSRRAYIHSQLLTYNGEQLTEAAETIKTLSKEIKNAYKNIDHFTNTGENLLEKSEAPSDPKVDEGKLAMLRYERQLVNQNISKHKKPNGNKILLAEYQDKKNVLDKLINECKG